MKKLSYSFAIISFLLIVNVGKSQDVSVENILWGDKLSKDIYVGVTNRFLVSPDDLDFILFDSARITASRSGDTLTLFPHSAGKQKIYFQNRIIILRLVLIYNFTLIFFFTRKIYFVIYLFPKNCLFYTLIYFNPPLHF